MNRKSKIIFVLFLVIFLICLQNNFFVTNVSAKETLKSTKISDNNHNLSTTKNMDFLVVMKPRHNDELSKFVLKSNNKKFISPDAFSKKYGQSGYKINNIIKYLKKYHLSTKLYKGNIVLNVSGSMQNIKKALHFESKNVHKDGVDITAPNHKLSLPKRYNKYIIDIIGFNNYDNINKKVNNIDTNKPEQLKKGGPDKFINQYNISPLYKDYSKNSSIGIISFGSFNKSDVSHFWSKMKVPSSNNRIYIHKQKNSKMINNSDETAMDLEQAGTIAPKSKINVYLSSPTVFGMLNSLSESISDNKSDTLSLSWGISEAEIQKEIKLGILSKHYNKIINLILEQAAAQGISFFNASGDNGAYDGISSGITKLTVETPSSSPYVTSVGATSLPINYRVNNQQISIDKERAWSNDFLYPYFNLLKIYNENSSIFIPSYFAGSGGGFSEMNSLPSYQKNVKGVGTFNAKDYWNMNSGYAQQYSTPQTVTGRKTGRNLPDIVANGDPQTGYLVYNNGKWNIDGGTSIVTPQIAGVNSLMISKSHHRMGLWNPKIYDYAKTSKTPFKSINDKDNNSNLYYTGQSNTIYNQATGLGTADYYKLFKLMK
ncbi:S53 family peptidase [Apilactobacillus apisilvae]|uniref:S53 family peptidase n=1 Tax=Apilactobacillus apisilvae TaxID=2923364 RepID=A0ABY4PHF0_9LACO|nr:S53 family peptidase [Apilactobacillus apisilvae]UQS85235.1 S53 family peptidase [Apilactobacillus apisilvae]